METIVCLLCSWCCCFCFLFLNVFEWVDRNKSILLFYDSTTSHHTLPHNLNINQLLTFSFPFAFLYALVLRHWRAKQGKAWHVLLFSSQSFCVVSRWRIQKGNTTEIHKLNLDPSESFVFLPCFYWFFVSIFCFFSFNPAPSIYSLQLYCLYDWNEALDCIYLYNTIYSILYVLLLVLFLLLLLLLAEIE